MMLIVGRRFALKGMVSAALGLVMMHELHAQAPGDKTISFRWTLPEALAPTAAEDLGQPVEIVAEEGRGALLILVGSVAVVYLANSILRLREEIDGGTVIDTRSEEITIERDAQLPGGTILVLSPDGTTLYERDDIADPEALVKALVPGG